MGQDSEEWQRRIDLEEWIDLAEWADVRGRASPFPCPAAITCELWDLCVRVPPRLAASVTADDRIHAVVKAARRALERPRAWPAELPPAGRLTLGFAVSLPARADAPRWKPVRLGIWRDSAGSLRLLIGLAHELKPSPPPVELD